jgi:hypothetical protein
MRARSTAVPRLKAVTGPEWRGQMQDEASSTRDAAVRKQSGPEAPNTDECDGPGTSGGSEGGVPEGDPCDQ